MQFFLNFLQLQICLFRGLHKIHSQSGFFPVWTTSDADVKKNRIFRNLWCVHIDKEEREVQPVRTKVGGLIFRDFAWTSYGWPLKANF